VNKESKQNLTVDYKLLLIYIHILGELLLM